MNHFQVNETITESNLSGIADKLDQTAVDIRSSPDMNSVQLSLKNQALYLRMYQDKLVDPMTRQSIEMLDVARNIDQKLKFNRTSFREAMEELLIEVKEAEEFIKDKGTEFVQTVIKCGASNVCKWPNLSKIQYVYIGC